MTANSKMSGSVMERIDKVRPNIEVIKMKIANGSASLVSLRDDALEILGDADLWYYITLHPSQVGVHPINRGGAGVQPDKVIGKVQKFGAHGFSLIECHNAVAVERLESDYEDWNIALVARSNNQLAPVAKGSLKFFAITVNHTAQALRAINAELPCSLPDISQDGKIARAVLVAKDHRLKQGTETGIGFKVLRPETEKAFPEMVELIMKADNIPASVAHQDTPFTQMLDMAQMAAATEPGATPDWNIIIQRMKDAAPSNAEFLPELKKFVEKWSGGFNDPFLLHELDSYTKSVANVRAIPSAILGPLATIDLGGRSRWRIACLKAMSSAPGKYVLGGESRYITPSDTQAMASRLKQYVCQADDMMIQAQEALKKLQKVYPDLSLALTNHVNAFDIKLVAHVLGRPHAFGTFKSLLDIGGSLRADLEKESIDPKKGGLPAAWVKAARPNAESSPSVTLSRSGLVDANTQVALLKTKGCEVDSVATHSETEKKFTVIRVNAAGLTLRFGNKDQKVSLSSGLDAYTFKISTDKDCEQSTYA